MASQPPSVAAGNHVSVATKGASSSVASQAAGKGAAVKNKLVPPEEQFWERYSPHHEAPLSGIGSFALHFLIAGFLILAGWLGWLGLGAHRAALPTDAVRLNLGGGGGNKHAGGDTPGTPNNQEVAEAPNSDQNQTPVDPTKMERPDLKDPAVVPQNPLPEHDPNRNDERVIREGNENLRDLANINLDVQSKLKEGLRQGSKGKGGTGTGGGSGSGSGTGSGSGQGEGTRDLNARERRMGRWRLDFGNLSGPEYVRRLHALGATLAIPKDRGGADYWVIRDLRARPAQLLDEDISKIGQMYWNNVYPETVHSVVSALGLSQIHASNFIIFMPQELEDKLFDLELKYNNWQEDEIGETRFQVRPMGPKYVPVVVSQTRR
jgi:hypothetical protein